MHADDDAVLVRHYQQGDLKAFQALFEKYYRYVYKVFVLKGVPGEEAEDFTQDIFLKLTDALRNFQFRSAFKTYLDRTIANKLINFYRKRQQESLIFEARFGDALAQAFNVNASSEKKSVRSPGELFEGAEFRHLLARCLHRIKHLACRGVLALWLEGYKLRQIAQILAMPPGTVNSHQVRGRKALMKCLKTEYGK